MKNWTLEDFYATSNMNTQFNGQEDWDPDKYSEDNSYKNGHGYNDPTSFMACRDNSGSYRRFATTR